MAEPSRAGDAPATEPEQIEAEIAQTREDLGDTVAALAGKTDVKAQAKQKADETRTAAQEKASETAAAARRTLQSAPERATQAGDRVRTAAQANPAAAVAAASAGALVLLLLLRARRR
jgi:ElaB/YqjD/DUF883 family membrane-anchored ribosome-binding protein